MGIFGFGKKKEDPVRAEVNRLLGNIEQQRIALERMGFRVVTVEAFYMEPSAQKRSAILHVLSVINTHMTELNKVRRTLVTGCLLEMRNKNLEAFITQFRDNYSGIVQSTQRLS